MNITSAWFVLFLVVVGLIYYLFPFKKHQWVVILIANIAFSGLWGGWQSLPYLFVGIVTTWVGSIWIAKSAPDKKRIITISSILLLIAELAILKYFHLGYSIYKIICSIVNIRYKPVQESVLAPLGISYYTLSMIGYIIEIYWGNITAEKEILRFSVFPSYFPQMTSGPITRYRQMKEQIFAEHHFDHLQVLYGAQRILWGLFKKLVIADRAAIFVSSVFDNCTIYQGPIVFAAVLLFALQLYADFSGCMDIALGASECLGIHLPENFNSPFLSETVSEFWNRWHITMGAWFKDFLLYPMLKSGLVQRLRKRLQQNYSKKISKSIPTYLCMAVVWIVIGIWHGGDFKYLFASGILQGFYLISGEIFKPISVRITKHIKTDAFSWVLFRRLRTFLCLCSSWIFIKADSFEHGLQVLGRLFSSWENNVWKTMLALGLTIKDFGILIIGVLIMIYAAHRKEQGIDLRKLFLKQNIWAQWMIMLTAVFVIVIFGVYGPGYNAADFIYKNF